MIISSVEGNVHWLDGGAMFGNAPKPMWEKWVEVDDDNRIPMAGRGILLEVEGLKILFEVGIGNYMEPKFCNRYGIENADQSVLLESLKALDVNEGDINFVVLSHLHFDHAGGLVPSWPGINQDDWLLRFPNAQYLVGKEQFDRACNPHSRDKASYIPLLTDKLKATNRLLLVDEETVLPPSLASFLSFSFTHGHTPGLMHSWIKGEKFGVLFCSDLIPGLPWVHVPLSMGYDRYPEKVIEEKKKTLDRAIEENYYCFFTHDVDIPMASVYINDAGKYQGKEKFDSVVKLAI